MDEKDLVRADKALKTINRNDKIFTLYNDGGMSGFAIAKKYKMSTAGVLQIIKNHKQEEFALAKELFDKDFLKAATSERIKKYKKQLVMIMKKLKTQKHWGLYLEFMSELRRLESLQTKVEDVVTPIMAGGAKVVIINDIRASPETREAAAIQGTATVVKDG